MQVQGDGPILNKQTAGQSTLSKASDKDQSGTVVAKAVSKVRQGDAAEETANFAAPKASRLRGTDDTKGCDASIGASARCTGEAAFRLPKLAVVEKGLMNCAAASPFNCIATQIQHAH